MEISIINELSDWQDFQKYGAKTRSKLVNSGWGFFFLKLSYFVFFPMILFLAFVIFVEGSKTLQLIASLVVLFFAGGIALSAQMNKRLVRISEPTPGGAYLGDMKYTLGEDGFKVVSDGSEAMISWWKVLRIERTNGMIMIYTDTLTAHILPEKKLDAPDALWALLNERVGLKGG